MKNQSENLVSKTNRQSVISFMAGLFSLILYLPLLISLFVADFFGVLDTIANAIPIVVYFIGGILLGTIGLTNSNMALQQIKESGDIKGSRMIAIIGKVLSVLGIIANIVSMPLFFMQ
jgi:hypothetical protein